ncbi:hypothetical protein MMC10_000823 [Thelotrema lepadinum]|nr:hypothetical protein [Thelotrema lepadinum]
MGMPLPPKGTQAAILTQAEYTETRTFFDMQCGNASILLDFYSPVTPNDLVGQSMPFSYLVVSATGADSVVVYTDIDETWTGQFGQGQANFTTSNGLSMYTLTVKNAVTYATAGDQALWGTVVLASGNSNNTAVQSGNGVLSRIRNSFASNGTLAGANGNFLAGDIVALAQPITSTANATFIIGYDRTSAVNYMGKPQTPYYRSVYNDTLSAVQAFMTNYTSESGAAQVLQSSLTDDANDVAGTNYSTVIKLSLRQAYGACDVTIPQDTLDTDSAMVFVKDISGTGDAQVMDVLYPMFPVFYVLDPKWIGLTLEPLLQYLQSGAYNSSFFVHDLGLYPNAIGPSSSSPQMPVEESGNALILAYAYASLTGDTAWATKYTPLLQKYAADYLQKSGLNQVAQLSADVPSGPLANQTNLAIKAAVALNAFGKMTNMTSYSTAGLSFANQLYNGGLGTDANKSYFTFQYSGGANATNFSTTWVQSYNLYPDALFNLSTFPQAAFDMQSDYYPTLFPEVANTYGVPVYSSVHWARTDWAYFVGSYASNDTRTLFVDEVWSFLNMSTALDQVPFSDRYNVSGPGRGEYFTYKARPVVGGHFALLAEQYGPDSVSE